MTRTFVTNVVTGIGRTIGSIIVLGPVLLLIYAFPNTTANTISKKLSLPSFKHINDNASIKKTKRTDS